MRELILSALSQYGSPALFVVVTIASIGVPLPINLLLIVTGSMVAQRVMPMWSAIMLASSGSIIGDQIGYAIGRWGGTALVARFVEDARRPRAHRQRRKRRRAAGAGWGSS